MSPDLESQLLRWLGEDSEGLQRDECGAIVPIRLLMLRLALVFREGDDNLTESTEISLKAFDRANIFRSLMQLHRKKLIEFVGSGKSYLSAEEIQALYAKFTAGQEFGEVTLSSQGRVLVDSWTKTIEPTEPCLETDQPEPE